MAEIRIRCQVLKAIAAMSDGTANDISTVVPNLTPKQIQKALYNLCEDDEIRKIGVRERKHSNGKPWNIYRIRDESTPQDLSKKKVYKKSGRKNYSQELNRAATFDAGRNIWIIRYREKKIAMLTDLLKNAEGTRKDLIIGCINDYKV